MGRRLATRVVVSLDRLIILIGRITLIYIVVLTDVTRSYYKFIISMKIKNWNSIMSLFLQTYNMVKPQNRWIHPVSIYSVVKLYIFLTNFNFHLILTYALNYACSSKL